jgi:hypothetical protein
MLWYSDLALSYLTIRRSWATSLLDQNPTIRGADWSITVQLITIGTAGASSLPRLPSLSPSLLPVSSKLDFLVLPFLSNFFLSLHLPEPNRWITPIPAVLSCDIVNILRSAFGGRTQYRWKEQRITGVDLDGNGLGLLRNWIRGDSQIVWGRLNRRTWNWNQYLIIQLIV